MACPKCGCKVHYQYDGGNSDACCCDDERLERCAACGHVFDIEDSADEEDEVLDNLEAARAGVNPSRGGEA